MCLSFLCTQLCLEQHRYSSEGVRKGSCLVELRERQAMNTPCCPIAEGKCYERKSGDRKELL